jgi:3-oxoacyl-(acyl-carrier-protein) synthase
MRDDVVVVTGLGVLSSLGTGPEVFMEGLLAGLTGLEPVSRFSTEGCRSHTAGLVRDFDPSRYVDPLKLRRIDEMGRLALVACRLAAGDARMPAGTEGVGLVLGSANAGLHSTIRHLHALATTGPAGVPALGFSNTVGNAAASLCAIDLGLRGPNLTVVQKQASGLAAVVIATGMVREDRGAAFLCGGADDIEEHAFRIYDRFGPLSGSDGRPEASRPFCAERNGFVLGTGGHLLMLERAAAAARRGVAPYGEILGTGAAASACTPAAWPTQPDGIARAMRAALQDAGIQPADVSVVFASANSTPALDRVETLAIEQVFGPWGVPVVSIKGAVGEYGAAGAASLIAALLCLARGVVPPTLSCEPVDPAFRVDVSVTARPADGRIALVNSSADGGAHYSIIVRAASSPR